MIRVLTQHSLLRPFGAASLRWHPAVLFMATPRVGHTFLSAGLGGFLAAKTKPQACKAPLIPPAAGLADFAQERCFGVTLRRKSLPYAL
jgi:hypothetical protein